MRVPDDPMLFVQERVHLVRCSLLQFFHGTTIESFTMVVGFSVPSRWSPRYNASILNFFEGRGDPSASGKGRRRQASRRFSNTLYATLSLFRQKAVVKYRYYFEYRISLYAVTGDSRQDDNERLTQNQTWRGKSLEAKR